MNNAPVWMTDEAIKTLKKGYLNPGEEPYDMYRRIARTTSNYYPKGLPSINITQLDIFASTFEALIKGWLSPSSPVASNFGSNNGKGLPCSCLTGDTKIHTKNGFKEIKDIQIGDEVLTHLGKFEKVTFTQSRMSTDDLYELKVRKRGSYPLRITGNHPVLTLRGWVKVEDLTLKDRIFIEPITHSFNKPKSNKVICFDLISENRRKRKSSGSVQLINRVKVDTPEFMKFFGLWFADGHTTGNRTFGLTEGVEDLALLEEWTNITDNLFGIKGKIYLNDDTKRGYKSYYASYNSVVVATWLNETCNKGAKFKTIPDFIFECSDENLKIFLEYLVKGDGDKKKTNNHFRLRLMNEKLIFQLYYLSSRLGVLGDLSRGLSSYYKNKGEQVFDFGLTIQDFVSKKSKSESFSLRKLPYNEEVYDLTVENDHSFVAQGVVVHNCYGINVSNSIDNIYLSNHEAAMLSKNGGGLGVNLSKVIGSSKVTTWSKLFDFTANAVSQGR